MVRVRACVCVRVRVCVGVYVCGAQLPRVQGAAEVLRARLRPPPRLALLQGK